MKNFLFVFITLLTTHLFSQTYMGKGEVSFFSSTPIENIDATSKALNCELVRPAQSLEFGVLIESFKFAKSLMQEHFNDDYMESSKYPKATFKGVIQQKINLDSIASYPVMVKGDLTVHGVTQPREIEGTIKVIGNGKVEVVSNFTIKLVDHKISIPKLVFQKIAEVVEVKVKSELTLKK